MKAPKLPNTLHGLLRVALADLKKTIADPRYVVNMGAWHDGTDGAFYLEPKCEVCMAGAVMAQRCGVPPTEDARPTHFLSSLTGKFLAINSLREGFVLEALVALRGVSGWHELTSEDRAKAAPFASLEGKIPEFTKDQKGFFDALTELQLKLKKANL
jgi:hypothetical protein